MIAAASLLISLTDSRIRASRTDLTSSPLRLPGTYTRRAQHWQRSAGRDSAGKRRAATDRRCGPDTRRMMTSALLRARPLEAAQATDIVKSKPIVLGHIKIVIPKPETRRAAIMRAEACFGGCLMRGRAAQDSLSN